MPCQGKRERFWLRDFFAYMAVIMDNVHTTCSILVAMELQKISTSTRLLKIANPVSVMEERMKQISEHIVSRSSKKLKRSP